MATILDSRTVSIDTIEPTKPCFELATRTTRKQLLMQPIIQLFCDTDPSFTNSISPL